MDRRQRVTLNNSNSSVVFLFDNNGTQAKLESLGTGGVTINAPITFAATSGNNWAEVNAVSSSITFVSGANSTLEVTGSQVAGVRMFGGSSGISTTFNNTVNASGKYFSTSAVGQTINIGGAFTSGEFYLMNSGTLNLNSGGTINIPDPTKALRLGGDFGTTGTQDLTKGATFNLTSGTGGQTFSGIINSVGGNSSGALLIDSQNTSGTNSLGGDLFLDSSLTIRTSAGGGLILSGSTIDVKNSFLFVQNEGSVTVTNAIGSSTSGGTVVKQGSGLLTLNAANTFGGSLYVDKGTVATSLNAASFGATNGTTTGVIGLGPEFSNSLTGDTILSLTAASASLANPINVRYFGITTNKTIGSTNTTGTATYSGPIILNDSATLTAAPGGTTEFSGGIIVGTATNGQTVNGTPGITVNATGGTVLISGSQNYGPLNANSGTVLLASDLVTLTSLNVATSGTAVLTEHSGGPSNVKVIDVSALTIDGTTAFVGGDEKGNDLASPAPVPEPGTMGLLAFGAIAGTLLRRRSRRR